MVTIRGKSQGDGDGGVLNWVIGIDMNTVMCVKLMTSKNLLYKKRKKGKTNKQRKKLIPNFLWVICMEIC